MVYANATVHMRLVRLDALAVSRLRYHHYNKNHSGLTVMVMVEPMVPM
jgi:hypothetical protein